MKNFALGTFLLAICLFANLNIGHAEDNAIPNEAEIQRREGQELGIDPKDKSVPPEIQSNPTPAPVTTETTPQNPVAEGDPNIKDIDAEEFNVRVLKKSRSGRVILLEDLQTRRPVPGKVLLLKSGNDDAAGVRVLKNYTGKFAAKIVLPFKNPEVGDEFRALKKIGDRMRQMIREREKRDLDLGNTKTDEELAKEIAPDDRELDKGIPAAGGKKTTSKEDAALDDVVDHKSKKDKPSKTKDSKESLPKPLFTKDGDDLDPEDVELRDDEMSSETSNSDVYLEPNRHMISAQYASIRSIDRDANSKSYNALGARYGFNIGRKLLLKKPDLQDAFAAEIGLFYYTISGYAVQDDSVTVIPIIATIRYGVYLQQNLSFFGYLGLVKNNVSTNSDSNSVPIQKLQSVKPAFGLTGMFRIGPGWAIRGDIGYDLFGIGVVLKF